MSNYNAQIDVRQYAPKDKHPMIFGTYDSLKVDETMELINDHDPMPLYYQMKAELPDKFEWQYVEQGPEVWRVAITKKQA